MDLKEILAWIIGVFFVMPWWLKILAIGIIFWIGSGVLNILGTIVLLPVGLTEMRKEKALKEKTTAEITKALQSNLDEAFRLIVDGKGSGALEQSEYIDFLTKLAKDAHHSGAMGKLAELYSGDTVPSAKNPEKYKFWLESAAKAGNIEAIKQYFGFLEFDMASDAYDDALQSLEKAIAVSHHEGLEIRYLKGIAYYKSGDFQAVRRILENNNLGQYDTQRKYLLMQCAFKSNDILAAETQLLELEASGFDISADDYLRLYNYYKKQRISAEHRYEKEIYYFEKYAKCKDADSKVVAQIGGDVYYSQAVALDKVAGDQEKRTEEIEEAYKKAAAYNHPEALFYYGEKYWGTPNRCAANDYLVRAADNGHKDAKLILEKYGVEGVLVRPRDVEARSYLFAGGYELTATSKTRQWIQLCYGAQYKARLITNDFEKNYKNTFKSFEQLMNGVHRLYVDSVAQMLHWSIRVLISYGIDEYSAEDILERCDDLSLLPRVPQFEYELERIDNRARELNAQLHYAQASRGVWSGSGFGTTMSGAIKATVKASVAAGVMNAGSGILHGIGDSFVKSVNNAEIKKMSKALFERAEKSKEFCNAVSSACMDILEVVMDIVEMHCGISLEIEGQVLYDNNDLSTIDDRTLENKIANNWSTEKYEYTNALLIEALRRTPLDSEVFQKVAILAVKLGEAPGGDVHTSMARYAGDLGIDVSSL